MKRIIFIIIILIFSTGCTSYTELNDLSIVNTLGIDYKNDEYYITLSVIENDNNIETYTSNNKSINRAINDIYLSSNKKLYLSHLDLLILTKDSINYRINDILATFLKNNEYRNNFQVILMKNSDMDIFFKNKYKSQEINNLIDTNSKETSIAYKKELESLFKDILIDNNSYLPTINYKDNILKLNGYTLITNKKVNKLLSNNESILLNILSKHSNSAHLNNINIYNSNIDLKINNNLISFKIYLTTDTNNKKKIKNLEKKFIVFLNKYRYDDILKIRDMIKKNNYRYYKNHNNLLKELKFEVKIINKKQNNYIKGD